MRRKSGKKRKNGAHDSKHLRKLGQQIGRTGGTCEKDLARPWTGGERRIAWNQSNPNFGKGLAADKLKEEKKPRRNLKEGGNSPAWY